MKRTLAVALLVLLAGVARGQEFDIFEVSDFVDPRVRGAEYTPDGLRITDGGYPFLVSRVSLGAISDYYWRTNPTGADVAVLHDVTSYYWGANQINLKLTHLEPKSDDALLPETRGVVQFARYTARPDERAAQEGARPVVINRYMVGLAVEDNPDGGLGGREQRALNYELGAEIDVRLPGTDVLGTFSYVKRFAGEGKSTQRFAYVLHTALHQYRRVDFDMSVAFGAEKTNGWRWGDIRPTVHMRLPLDKVGTVVHVAYAPTISFEGGFNARHEVALFVDRAFFAHVFLPKDKPEE